MSFKESLIDRPVIIFDRAEYDVFVSHIKFVVDKYNTNDNLPLVALQLTIGLEGRLYTDHYPEDDATIYINSRFIGFLDPTQATTYIGRFIHLRHCAILGSAVAEAKLRGANWRPIEGLGIFEKSTSVLIDDLREIKLLATEAHALLRHFSKVMEN